MIIVVDVHLAISPVDTARQYIANTHTHRWRERDREREKRENMVCACVWERKCTTAGRLRMHPRKRKRV